MHRTNPSIKMYFNHQQLKCEVMEYLERTTDTAEHMQLRNCQQGARVLWTQRFFIPSGCLVVGKKHSEMLLTQWVSQQT